MRLFYGMTGMFGLFGGLKDFQQSLVLPGEIEAGYFCPGFVFALADIREGTAEAVVRHIEWLDPDANHKLVIATTHDVLTDLFQKGLLGAREDNGDLIFNLHKITEANQGATDPDLLAPGLD